MSGEADPLADNEILYRRVLPTYFPDPTQPPIYQAFRPRNYDIDGISLFRAKHKSAKVAATPRNLGDPLHPVAALRAGDLRDLGMTLDIDPNDPAHVLVSNLTFSNREEPRQESWQIEMAEKLCRVFDANPDEPLQVWPAP